MKLLLLAFVTLTFSTLSIFAQGSLTPPSAPTPTMKSLDQIEPRTPIPAAASTVTISNPGSYYLTGNITVATGNGVTVSASNVTLNLNGFTIASTSSSPNGAGVLLSGALSNIAISNGNIHGTVTASGVNLSTFTGGGFSNGISYDTSLKNTRVAQVNVSGCNTNGIYLANSDSTVIESCNAATVGGSGLVAGTVRGSTAVGCGSDGITGNIVSDSRGDAVNYGSGITAVSVAQNCWGTGIYGPGITGNMVINCNGYAGDARGISATSVENSTGGSAYDSGISATTATGCYGMSLNGVGLSIVGSAENCYGTTSGPSAAISASAVTNSTGISSGNGSGISAAIVNSSAGTSNGGYGIQANYIVNTSFGLSSSGTGIYVNGPASYCGGQRAGGYAIHCTAAIGCSTYGGTIDCPPANKFLGSP